MKTNDTWFGKSIYTKTVYIASLPNASEGLYPHNIENIDNIWINSGKSYINSTTGNNLTVPHLHLEQLGAQFQFSVSSENIRIDTGNADRRTYQAYVTIEYTKTTD